MRFTFALILCLFAVKQQFAQDTIVKRNNQVVIARVIEISETEVQYKRFDLPDGPLYIENKAGIAYIAYSNGNKDKFTPAQDPEPVSILTSPQFLYKSPELRITANRITYLGGNNWDQKGKTLTENDLHTLLLSTNDPTLIRLTKLSKAARKGSYVGFASIPVGIAGIALAYTGMINLFGSYNFYAPEVSEPGNLFLGSIACAAVAVSTNIYGVSMYHAHRRKNAQAIEIYNQKY